MANKPCMTATLAKALEMWSIAMEFKANHKDWHALKLWAEVMAHVFEIMVRS